jgi:hypothetical protein
MRNRIFLRIATIVATLLTFHNAANAYVFVGGTHPTTHHPARLPVSPESPQAHFRISGSIPSISGKEKFMSGQYKDLDDSEFFRALVTESMNRWNAVSDSYLEMVIDSEAGPGKNETDLVNDISFGDTSWSSAGEALPLTNYAKVSADKSLELVIEDCDIELDPEVTEAEKLARVVLHEIGHCLGLGHPHSSSTAIMSYNSSSTKFSLEPDDKAGAIVLYPVHPSARKDLIPVCGTLASTAKSKWLSFAFLFITLFPAVFVGLKTHKRIRPH